MFSDFNWAESLAKKQNVDTVVADWHSALLKLSVRRKIMCIPIIYILCVKILRMYSVKNSFMLMVICCFHILAAWPASSTASWQHEGQKKAVWSAFLWIFLDLLSFPTLSQSQHHLCSTDLKTWSRADFSITVPRGNVARSANSWKLSTKTSLTTVKLQ